MRPQTLLLDLEGTMYTRDGMIEGALDALERLRADGHEVRFLTNTDSQDSASIFAGLLDRGLVVQPTEVFTPIVAARLLLAASPDAVVLALTTEEVKAELHRGARLSDGAEDSRVTHVVVGDVRNSLSYGLLDEAFQALQTGAELVALQKGRYFLSGGSAHVDTGAIVAALEYASGRKAFVVGKPSASFVALAMNSTAPPSLPADTWVVGDDRTTDIPMGLAAGAHTVLVRTGKFSGQSSDAALAAAEHTIGSIAELPEMLARVVA